jgi:hypothetical protein
MILSFVINAMKKLKKKKINKNGTTLIRKMPHVCNPSFAISANATRY